MLLFSQTTFKILHLTFLKSSWTKFSLSSNSPLSSSRFCPDVLPRLSLLPVSIGNSSCFKVIPVRAYVYVHLCVCVPEGEGKKGSITTSICYTNQMLAVFSSLYVQIQYIYTKNTVEYTVHNVCMYIMHVHICKLYRHTLTPIQRTGDFCLRHISH